MIPARRRFLTLSASGMGSLLVAPQIAFARVVSNRRFVFVIQRGAADGLSLVPPYGDPAYGGLRGALAETGGQAIKLDGLFALHPALTQIGGMYAKKQALFVHAVASPYRERSHFDGQNVLETGGSAPYRVKEGWINRLVAQLPKAGGEDAIAFAPTVPLALRGAASVTSYAPSALPQAPDDLLARVGQLYAADAQLGPLWQTAMQTRSMAGDAGARQDPASLGRLAASFLARENGPSIAMLETGGWDTHAGQVGRLNAQLKALDTLVAALRDGLGAVWNDTVVLVATEFGRTAAINGTGGTDHGTGSVAMVLGGAVRGGRVIADWPGLGPGALHEGRDLKPTTNLYALIADVAAETFGLDPQRVTKSLFESATASRRLDGLISPRLVL